MSVCFHNTVRTEPPTRPRCPAAAPHEPLCETLIQGLARRDLSNTWSRNNCGYRTRQGFLPFQLSGPTLVKVRKVPHSRPTFMWVLRAVGCALLGVRLRIESSRASFPPSAGFRANCNFCTFLDVCVYTSRHMQTYTLEWIRCGTAWGTFCH